MQVSDIPLTIDGLPDYYYKLLILLNKQKLMTFNTDKNKKPRFQLYNIDESTCEIINVLCSLINTGNELGVNFNDYFHGNKLKKRLELYYIFGLNHFIIIKNKFNEVIQNIKLCWIQTTFKETPEILIPYNYISDDDWFIFKQPYKNDICQLIRYMIKLFIEVKQNHDEKCYITDQVNNGQSSWIYFCVKKDCIEEVYEAFKFDVMKK